MVSAGHAQPTAHHARGRESTAPPLLALAYPRMSSCRAHGGPQFRVRQLPSPGRTNSAIASGVVMAMAHCAFSYRRYTLAVLGEVPHKKTHAEKAAHACGAWLALAAAKARAHPCTMETNQHSFNHDFPMRAIMYSCCHECIHVSCLRGAPMYYICNYTFKNMLPLSFYPIAKKLNTETIFPRPLIVPRTCCFTSHMYHICTQHN